MPSPLIPVYRPETPAAILAEKIARIEALAHERQADRWPSFVALLARAA